MHNNRFSITNFIEVIEKILTEDIIIYNDKIIGMRIENDTLFVFNSYYFREHLKKAGFIWSKEDKAWVGEPEYLMNLSSNVVIRMLYTTSKKSLRKLIDYYKNKYAEVSVQEQTTNKS